MYRGKLNDKAGDNDWGTQEVLGGSRPDYHKEIDSTHVFADLTTDRESGGIGLHIWEKLKKVEIHMREVWEQM